MLVSVEGGKSENPEKSPRSKARTNNRLDPNMESASNPGPHWWDARKNK